MKKQTYLNCETGGQIHVLPSLAITYEKLDGIHIVGITVTFLTRWHAIEFTWERRPKWPKGHALKNTGFSLN
jgi:hypothetical protein